MGGDGQGTQGSPRLGRRQKEQDHMGYEIFKYGFHGKEQAQKDQQA